EIIQQSILFVISMVLLVQTDFVLSLVLIPCFLSYYILGPYFEKNQTLWAKEGQIRRVDANKRMFDSVSAMLEVRAFGTQRWDQNMVMQRIKHMHKADTIDNVFGYARGTYRRLTTGAGAFAVFAVGAYLLQAD